MPGIFSPYWTTVTPEDTRKAADSTPSEPVKRETSVATLPKSTAISGPQHPTQTLDVDDEVIQLPPSYVWGSMPQGNWVQTENTDKVFAGDIVRFNQRLKMPFLQQWQTDIAIEKFSQDSRFTLLYWGLNEETRTLVVVVQARTSFSPVPIIAVAVVAILATAFIWVTTTSIERLGTFNVAGVKFNVTPLIVFGGLILGGLALFQKGKG